MHSTVRDAVTGPGSGPVYSGTSAFRGLVPVDALPSLPDPHAIQFWAGPGAHLLHYALGRDDDTSHVVLHLRSAPNVRCRE